MLPIVSTLIYIISPFDILPDTIPVVGYIDDIAILSWALKSINPDLEKKFNISISEADEQDIHQTIIL